jgi:hypothetical protein
MFLFTLREFLVMIPSFKPAAGILLLIWLWIGIVFYGLWMRQLSNS